MKSNLIIFLLFTSIYSLCNNCRDCLPRECPGQPGCAFCKAPFWENNKGQCYNLSTQQCCSSSQYVCPIDGVCTPFYSQCCANGTNICSFGQCCNTSQYCCGNGSCCFNHQYCCGRQCCQNEALCCGGVCSNTCCAYRDGNATIRRVCGFKEHCTSKGCHPDSVYIIYISIGAGTIAIIGLAAFVLIRYCKRKPPEILKYDINPSITSSSISSSIYKSNSYENHFEPKNQNNTNRNNYYTNMTFKTSLYEDKKPTTCYRCHGTKYENCNRCFNSGYLTCGTCHGSRKVTKSVQKFYDNQNHTVQESVHCSSCSEGKITCSACMGNARITCGLCKGSGTLN